MKEYRKAEIEIIAINSQDIIATSGDGINLSENEIDIDFIDGN